MAITTQYLNDRSIRNYTGLSTDPKPSAAPNSKFWETDTGKIYERSASGWVEISQSRTFRETQALLKKNWIESMYITKAEFGADFGLTHQVLNKIYDPVIKSGTKTLAVASSKGFDGKTNTLVEVEVDSTTTGTSPTTTFKWRKKTFSRVFGNYTAGISASAGDTVTDGIKLDFDDSGYTPGNKWHVQGCGSWHTPEDGKESFLTSIAVYPMDTAKAAKLGLFRVYAGDFRVVDYGCNKGEFLDWRAPLHLTGDDTKQFKIQMAEIGSGQIDSIFVIMEGWDE